MAFVTKKSNTPTFHHKIDLKESRCIYFFCLYLKKGLFVHVHKNQTTSRIPFNAFFAMRL